MCGASITNHEIDIKGIPLGTRVLTFPFIVLRFTGYGAQGPMMSD